MSTEATDLGFDIDAGVSDIADSLGLGLGSDRDDSSDDSAKEGADISADAEGSTQPAATRPSAKPNGPQPGATVQQAVPPSTPPTMRNAPKSWAKETHEIWSKLDPKAQDQIELREKQMLDGIESYKQGANYGKQVRDVVAPFVPLLRSQGIDETQAIGYLFQAHAKLTSGSPEQRAAAYAQLGQDLGFKEGAPAAPVDPQVRALQQEVARINSSLSAEQQRQYNDAKQRADTEVESFSADPAHQYFGEVAQDMVDYINAGDDIKAAYEKAVWANPVTRAKEMARIQTESETKAKADSQAKVETARRATSVNARGKDSSKAPTDPLGNMEDTMRDTLKKINARAH